MISREHLELAAYAPAAHNVIGRALEVWIDSYFEQLGKAICRSIR